MDGDHELPSIRMANFPPKMPIISVGGVLPYGQRLIDAKSHEIIRFKDFARRKRVLLVGVIGAYSPPCWNTHVDRVLQLMGPWCSEAENGEVCLLSTNDSYCLKSWGLHLQLPENVRLLSDFTGKFTRLLGMDIQIAHLGDKVRSRRYILQADNMEVRNVLVAPDDDNECISLICNHRTD